MQERNELGNGGYVVSKSDRKGKTHKVTGPDGTVKHFGDPNLKNRPNNPKAKKSWYARHKKNLDNNPHFRAYARATWAEGGDMDQLPPSTLLPIGYQPVSSIMAYEKFTEFKPDAIDIEGLKKGIAHVESADGVLMKNPESSATGLYGQLFNQIKGTNLYSGTRDEFAKDIDAQNRVFDVRLNKGFDNKGGLIRDANDLYKEYAPQIENFEYSKEDLIALSNFLGRQGAREYLGYHVRDGKPLSEALPNIYGSGTDTPRNKTPQEYLYSVRKYYGQDADKKAMGGMIDKNVMMQDLYGKGGQMIKRADGSYSRRGLWDNIRANRGSGKKPTKEMLEQERKIKAEEKAMGGEMYAQGGGIEIDPAKRGTFKAQATRMGMSVQEAAEAILNAPKGKYSPEMRKKANFAKNFAKAYGGNMYAYGGELPYSFEMGGEMLQTIDNGGTHEENPNGGVPATPDGMNLVEEGETVMNGNFVFSNRLKVTPEIAREFSLGKKAVGKTYADVSKSYKDDERPNDRFINKANKITLDNLAEAQESYKAVEQAKYEQDAMEMQDAVMQQQMMEAQQQQMQEPIDPNNPMVRSQIAQMGAIQQQQAQEMQQAMLQQGMAQGQPMMPQQQMGYGGKMKYQTGGPFGSTFMDLLPQSLNQFNTNMQSISSGAPFGSVPMDLLPQALNQYNAIYNTDYDLGEPDPSMVTPPLAFEDTEAVDMMDLILTPQDYDLTRQNIAKLNPEIPQTTPVDPSMRRRKIGEALSYAPAVTSAAGMIQAMRDRVPNLQAAQTDIRFDQPAMDMTQARADAATAMRTGMRGAAAGSRGSVGTYLDATERITGATARALGQTAMQQEMYNRQLEQQANQLAYQQAARNAQARMMADDFNIAGETAKTDRILEMMAATGQNIGNIGIDIQNREMVNQMPYLYDIYAGFKGMRNTGNTENPNG
jgi:hypothetical protein